MLLLVILRLRLDSHVITDCVALAMILRSTCQGTSICYNLKSVPVRLVVVHCGTQPVASGNLNFSLTHRIVASVPLSESHNLTFQRLLLVVTAHWQGYAVGDSHRQRYKLNSASGCATLLIQSLRLRHERCTTMIKFRSNNMFYATVYSSKIQSPKFESQPELVTIRHYSG